MDKNITGFNTTSSLAHTKWNCKYHIVFAPKYRRKVFYEEKRVEIREILRTLCRWKGVEVIEGEICPDHIHILVSIPPKMSVSGFMGYLKGKSTVDSMAKTISVLESENKKMTAQLGAINEKINLINKRIPSKAITRIGFILSVAALLICILIFTKIQ